MLDNRYDSDDDDQYFGTGDILGEDQWLWLDLAMKRGLERKVDMTFIGAGINILPERLYLPMVDENFRWKNRERLFRILRENQAENVTLISGDVHFGQLYKAQCPGFTG